MRLITSSPNKRQIRTRDKLALEHLEWALGIAKHVASMLPTWFTEDDLTGPVELALLKQAAKYDPARGIPFRAFAARRIYGACFDSVRRKEYKERGHLTLTPTEYGIGHGGSGFGEYSKNKTAAGERYADAAIIDPAPGPEEQAAECEQTRHQVRVWAVVQRLPSRHMLVILGVYGGGSTLVELSEKVGVGAARLSQIHREALGMMRVEMEKAA